MVEIAKALSLDAKVLIMDEPTSSLTLTETEQLLKIVEDLRAQGVGIVYISHRLSEVKGISDRVVAMRDGQNAGDLAKADITHENMVRLMVGRELKRSPEHDGPRQTRDCLNVENLETSRYPGKTITFDVKAGEVLCLAGLVGAGRSEVVQAIFGADRCLGGSITLDGKAVTLGDPRKAIDAGICLVPEDRRHVGLIVEWSVKNNISLPGLEKYAKFGLLNKKEETDAATLQSKALGVKTPTVDGLVGNLSGGNQQKVVVGKWMLQNPKVLILDEPTRGVDVGAKSEIYELMRHLADQGVAILMVSSDMEEVLGVSDRVAVMHEGKITGVLSRSEFSEEGIMRLAVGKVQDS
jgi:ribose transport system ATP-binding protein